MERNIQQVTRDGWNASIRRRFVSYSHVVDVLIFLDNVIDEVVTSVLSR